MNDPGDRRDFARMIGVLAEVLREQISDVAVEAYFAALGDLPLAHLQAAAGWLARNAEYFPKPAEWRARANDEARRAETDARMARLRLVKGANTDAGIYRCPVCQDNGWVCMTCGRVDCRQDAPEHTRRMRRCGCRENGAA